MELRRNDDSKPKVLSQNNFISKSEGYKLFGPDLFNNSKDLIKACQSIFESRRSEIVDTKTFNKEYFFNIATLEDLKIHHALIDFAINPFLTDIVSGYLKNPRLHSVGVYYSSVNETIEGSQLFHVDGDSLRQMKCFINIWDVDEGMGPFTFIPGSLVDNTLRNRGLIKNLSDEDLAQIKNSSSFIQVTGKSGSGVFCDTSRCLHQGSRALKQPRLVYMVQFVSRPDALLEHKLLKTKKGGHILITDNLLSSLGIEKTKFESLV